MDLYTFNFMCKGLLPECMSVYPKYAVPTEARRGH